MIDYTCALVLQGAACMGALSGVIGVFALLREQSLLGDAISHAALPGIVLMFLLTHSKNPWILLCGGGIAGICGIWMVHTIINNSCLKKDSVLGILLSVFFGLGLVLMTIAQKYSCSGQAILNKFLFGNIATLLPVDVLIIKCIFVLVISVIVLFWKEISLYVFDHQIFNLFGFSPTLVEIILTTLLVLTIIVGLQTVGVVLMSTLLIAPAAAARQWTKKLSSMVLLAGFFGSTSACCVVSISRIIDGIPTGPMIVICASLIAFASLMCAPKRKITV